MGPSGSGKTTVMEAICGLRKVHGGQIVLDGRDITHLRPGERTVALVPQDNVLFPHLNVRDHLNFGPQLQKWPKQEALQRVDELAEALGLKPLLDRKPAMLSGGEAKRVALGRALATRPKLLCLDEALTGLDTQSHEETLDAIKSVITKENITTFHITHSPQEAQRLSHSTLTMQELTA